MNILPPPPHTHTSAVCLSPSLHLFRQTTAGYRNLSLLIILAGRHGALSLDDMRLHLFLRERAPMLLPQPFNSDVRSGMTGRVKVLATGLPAVI